jgi:DNA-binding protein YbaB
MANTKQTMLELQREVEKQENEIARRKFDAVNSQGVVDSLTNAKEALVKEVEEKDKLITSYE